MIDMHDHSSAHQWPAGFQGKAPESKPLDGQASKLKKTDTAEKQEPLKDQVADEKKQ